MELKLKSLNGHIKKRIYKRDHLLLNGLQDERFKRLFKEDVERAIKAVAGNLKAMEKISASLSQTAEKIKTLGLNFTKARKIKYRG